MPKLAAFSETIWVPHRLHASVWTIPPSGACLITLALYPSSKNSSSASKHFTHMIFTRQLCCDLYENLVRRCRQRTIRAKGTPNNLWGKYSGGMLEDHGDIINDENGKNNWKWFFWLKLKLKLIWWRWHLSWIPFDNPRIFSVQRSTSSTRSHTPAGSFTFLPL